MIKSGTLVAFLLCFGLYGCASPDRRGCPAASPWTEADQRAVDALAEEWRARPPASAPSAPEVVAREFIRPRRATSDRLLNIYVFDMGQADSMLVIGPRPESRTLLVDLGQRQNGAMPSTPRSNEKMNQYVLRRIQELTQSTHVDYFVATHYHADHLGSGGAGEGRGSGIIGLLNDPDVTFSVGEFIHVGRDGAQFMEPEQGRGVYMAIKTLMPLWLRHHRVGRDSRPHFRSNPNEPNQIDLGPGTSVEILSFAGKTPDGENAFQKAIDHGADYGAAHGNENDLSIALQISAGEFEMFTAGDLNGTDDPGEHPFYVRREFGETYTNIEHHLVDYWRDHGRESDVEVYRANHHGSAYSSTDKLLNALDPEFILYSTGGYYDHPEVPIVNRGAATARQFATTAVANRRAFTDRRTGRGIVVGGEIEILVDRDGRTYSINGQRHRAFTAAEEAAGDDRGEEDRQR